MQTEESQDWLSRQTLESETQKDASYCLSLSGLLSYFSYTVQAYLYKDGTAHSDLESSTSIINLKRAPRDVARGQSDRGSSKVPSTSESRSDSLK